MTDTYTPRSEIAAFVANVNKAGVELEASAEGDVHVARRKLKLEAQRLLDSLKEPNAEVWTRIFQINVSCAVEIVSQLELWGEFGDREKLSTQDIVQFTKADELIILRTFRQLVAANLFREHPGPSFQITTLGRPYLQVDHRAFNNFIFFDIIPAIIEMPRKLAEHGYKSPTKQTGTPYKWARGDDLWSWLGSHPERKAIAAAGMHSHNPMTAYPWAAELQKLDLEENDVAIVDIAGGQGDILADVRKQNPTIKGRFIVQDLPATFEVTAAPPPGIEFMKHDMFTPQPVEGAFFYHYRHIFHNWNDDDCGTILGQIVPLLRTQPKSRLLLVDVVLPNSDATMAQAIMDMTMLVIGGMERTENQWDELLKRNGLKIKKIWRGSEPEACIECELLNASDSFK